MSEKKVGEPIPNKRQILDQMSQLATNLGLIKADDEFKHGVLSARTNKRYVFQISRQIDGNGYFMSTAIKDEGNNTKLDYSYGLSFAEDGEGNPKVSCYDRSGHPLNESAACRVAKLTMDTLEYEKLLPGDEANLENYDNQLFVVMSDGLDFDPS